MAESFSTVYARARSAIGTGGEADVIPALEDGLKQNASDARGWQVLGLLYRGEERLSPALAAFERASALAPNDGLIALGAAQCQLEAGHDAVGSYRRAYARATDLTTVLPGLAAALAATGCRDEAIAELDSALESRPTWFEGHWLAARLRWLSGEVDYAMSIDRVLTRNPTDVLLWQMRLAIDSRAARFDAVLQTVDRARTAIGAPAWLPVMEAIAHSERGNAPAADAILAPLTPSDPSTLVQVIRHHLRMGRPDRVIALGQPHLNGAFASSLWPYLALAWRLRGDANHRWLEQQQGLVGTYDLADRIDLKALAEHLRNVHTESAAPLEQSVRAGTQTDGPLFSRVAPEIAALRSVIVDAVERHIAQLPGPDPRHPQLSVARGRPVRFAGAWSVRLTDGGHHIGHVHPEGWFSSAFYVAVPQGMGHNHAGWLRLGIPDPGLDLGLGPLQDIEPKPGRLVLFPSTLWHATTPFAAGERLTVAFDVRRP